MLDLVEGAKIVVGVTPTTLATANAAYINTENMHSVTAIVLNSLGGTGAAGVANVVEGNVAESYAGVSNSPAKCQYWYNMAVSSTVLAGHDRLTKSTATSSGIITGTTHAIIVIRHDPATADTSDHYFGVEFPTSGGGMSVVYICEPRYGGENQFIATTSST